MRQGDLVLDLGCGFGRHAYESLRRGARVVACDYSLAELKDVAGMFAAIEDAEAARSGAMRGLPTERPPGSRAAMGSERSERGGAGPEDAEAASLPAAATGTVVNGDGTRLPFPDDTFDRIIAAEVLEHIPDDGAAIGELARVLKPGGRMAVTVPAWLAERVCWALTDEYHAPFVEGGHVRIYTERGLRRKLRDAGLRPGGAHHAHALHTPYWWLKCAVGVTDAEHPFVRAYHQVLLWDIGGRQPMATVTKLADRLANPVLGKSLVVYARKPVGL